MTFSLQHPPNPIFHFIFPIFHCHEQQKQREKSENPYVTILCNIHKLAEQTSMEKSNNKRKTHTESPVNVMSCSQMLKSRLPASKLSSKIKSPLQIFFSFAALIVPLVVVTLFSHFVIAARTTAELMENTRRMRNVARKVAITRRVILVTTAL